jgi:hypothetical protein
MTDTGTEDLVGMANPSFSMRTMGKSGNFEISDGVTSIRIKQDKVQELDQNYDVIGSKQWNLSGSGDFSSPVTQNDGTYVVTYNASDARYGEFRLVILVASSEDSLQKDPFTQKQVALKADNLKFSVEFKNWAFESASNILRYGLVIQTSDLSPSVPGAVPGPTPDTPGVLVSKVRSRAGEVEFPSDFYVGFASDPEVLEPRSKMSGAAVSVSTVNDRDFTVGVMFRAEENLARIVYDPGIVLESTINQGGGSVVVEEEDDAMPREIVALIAGAVGFLVAAVTFGLLGYFLAKK